MNYNPYQFGGYQPAQQRFGQAATNYMTQPVIQQVAPQMPPQVAPQPAGIPLRFVSSKEELAASQIPFDGSTNWFYNTAADTIHSKTFDFNTGTAPIVTYVREQPAPAVQYVTVEALESLMQEVQNLKDELDVLKNRKGKKNEPNVPDE